MSRPSAAMAARSAETIGHTTRNPANKAFTKVRRIVRGRIRRVYGMEMPVAPNRALAIRRYRRPALRRAPDAPRASSQVAPVTPQRAGEHRPADLPLCDERSADHPCARLPYRVEMKVGILEVESNRGHRLRCPAGDLGDVEFDSVRQADENVMFSPGRRALDRTGRGFQYARDDDAGLSPFDIRVELERFEERRVNGARHGRIDPPVRRALAGLFAIHDGRKRVPLPVVRPLIENSLTFTVALVDGPRPPIEECGTEAIERYVSKASLIDPNGGEAAAVSMCRTGRLELTRTGVIATAITDLDPFDVPVNLRHRTLRTVNRNGTLLQNARHPSTKRFSILAM